MDNLKKWGLPIYAVWSVLSLIVCVAILVINCCFEKPYTAGYEYFDGISTGELTSDDVSTTSTIPIFEVNYQYSDTNPDLQLFELVITEYTDYEQQSYTRYVMQAVGQFNVYCYTKSDFENPQSYGTGNFYFYQLDNSGDLIDLKYDEFEEKLNSLDVTAGGNSYKVELGGEKGVHAYTYYKTELILGFITNTTEETKYAEYNSYDLFAYMFNYFSKNEDFEGSKVFNNLDLDKFFTIRANNGSGQFYSLSQFNENNAYFNVKYANKNIHTYLTVENSLAGRIASDSNYSSGVVNTVTPYYSTSVGLTLTEYVFTKEYTNVINKNVLVISDKFREYLNSLNNLNITVNINLDNLSTDYVANGINLDTFKNLNVTSVNITSANTQDFYVLGSSSAEITFSDTITALNSQGGAFNG